MEILDLLWELNGAGPTELAEQMELPDSTVYDYLRSLSETKYVTRENGRYRLSTYFLTIGGQMRHRNRLFQIANPEMKRVAAKTNELVGLTVESDGRAVVFHQEEGSQSPSPGTYPGTATLLHTIASGKAILVHLPEKRVDEIVSERGLEPRTEYTVTDVDRLKDELESIREDEYALDLDQQVIGMAAVPIVIDDRVLGALAIVVPSQRLQDDSYKETPIQELQKMKNTVTVNYQYSE